MDFRKMNAHRGDGLGYDLAGVGGTSGGGPEAEVDPLD
jgi:hypothetical protein